MIDSKKNKVLIIVVIITIILSVLITISTFSFDNIFNSTKISGKIYMSCIEDTISINNTTTCTLYGKLMDSTDTYSVSEVKGLLTYKNIKIVSINKNDNIFTTKTNTQHIDYVAKDKINANNEFEIASIVVKGIKPGKAELKLSKDKNDLYFRIKKNKKELKINEIKKTLTIKNNTKYDNRLSSIDIVGLKIPSFNPNTDNYELNVDNSVNKIVINATPIDSNSSLTGDIGTKELEVGKNEYKIKVISKDNKEKVYTIVINRSAN